MKKIGIIEDDIAMRTTLADLLKNSNYEPRIYQDFTAAGILADLPDLLLLDLNLSGSSGLQILKDLHAANNLPVVVLTSSSFEADEALSMSYGADDYVTKPYNPSILLLRIAAVLRRVNTSTKAIRFRHLVVDLDRGVLELAAASSENPRILLTKNEMIILRHLLENSGKIVARNDLMTDLWNNQEYINDNALTVNISRLRAKLAKLGADDAIETRKNLGYILS